MPELRRPSDRDAMWQHWRRRINGERLPVSDEPQLGLYRAKRRGNFVGVQIDLLQLTDEDGFLTEPEMLAAFIGNESFYGARVDEIWLRCADSPITEAEFERLAKMPAVTDLSREFIC